MDNARISTMDDVYHIAANMRKDDRNEVFASGGMSPLKAMKKSFEYTEDCATFLVNGKPAAMFGLKHTGLITRTGIPWLLGTDDIQKDVYGFLKLSKVLYNYGISRCDYMYNFVDVRNTESQKWLKWMGFDVEEAQPYGLFGMPFKKFYKEVK